MKKLSDLVDGQVVRARWARADEYGPKEWIPWQSVILQLRRETGPAAKRPVPKRGRYGKPPLGMGEIACLTFTYLDGAPVTWVMEALDEGEPSEVCPWTEYTEADFFGGFFYSGSCYLEIEGLSE